MQPNCAPHPGKLQAGKVQKLFFVLAVRDFDGTVAGRKIEIVHADHQNKPDIGSAIARKWFDAEGVDVILN